MKARKLPESLAQARKADKRSALLQAFGVGPACAGQGSMSGQKGAGVVRPPCAACAPIVDTFPGPLRHGWAMPSPEALSDVPQDMPGVSVCTVPVGLQIAAQDVAT